MGTAHSRLYVEGNALTNEDVSAKAGREAVVRSVGITERLPYPEVPSEDKAAIGSTDKR